MIAAPAPITFSLDVAQCARIRRDVSEAAGEGGTIVWAVLLSCIGIGNAALSARVDGWHQPFVWLQIIFWSAYAPLIAWQAFVRQMIRSETATTVTFDYSGISIRRTGFVPLERRVSFRRIRSVRRTPAAIAIYGIWTAYVIIPVDAMPDSTQVMGFFEDRIVSRGMPQRSRHGVTTISNSLWPLLGRT